MEAALNVCMMLLQVLLATNFDEFLPLITYTVTLHSGDDLIDDVEVSSQKYVRNMSPRGLRVCCGDAMVTLPFQFIFLIGANKHLPNSCVLCLVIAHSHTNDAECSRRGTIAKLPLWS